MNLHILARARDDLIEGYFFYEDIESGLGDYFIACLYSDIEALKVYAGTHPKPHRLFHRALSKRFPFAIFYTVEENHAHSRCGGLSAQSLVDSHAS